MPCSTTLNTTEVTTIIFQGKTDNFIATVKYCQKILFVDKHDSKHKKQVYKQNFFTRQTFVVMWIKHNVVYFFFKYTCTHTELLACLREPFKVIMFWQVS